MPDDNIVLVEYQDLLEYPNKLKKALGRKLEVNLSDELLPTFKSSAYKNEIAVETSLDSSTHEELEKIFMQLQAKKIKLN